MKNNIEIRNRNFKKLELFFKNYKQFFKQSKFILKIFQSMSKDEQKEILLIWSKHILHIIEPVFIIFLQSILLKTKKLIKTTKTL